MPRNTNPGSIKTGPGKTTPATSDSLVLTGMTPPAVPPNFGKMGYTLPGMTLAQARQGLPAPGVEGSGVFVGGGDQSHINDPVDAHPASAIGLDTTADLFATNVQGAVNELAANVAPRPPMLGQSFTHMTFSGIPDWGLAKLNDGSRPVDGAESYPYYWTAPTPTTDWAGAGRDPQTDTVWNSTPSPIAVPGSGGGAAKAGAFTTGAVANTPINRTRGIALQMNGLNAYPVPVTVSGTVFPADRGVLALIHWPKENTVADFLAQSILDRCVAALKLGAGVGTSGSPNCLTKDTPPPATCDGAPGAGPSSGSIFTVGVDANGYYDPFAYPGQATGQYDLSEIHTGVAALDGTDLPAPWDGAPGWVRSSPSTAPGPGQVRLGTDPTADSSFDPAVVSPYGIPVLGAGQSGYNPAPATTVTLNDLVAYTRVGRSLLLTSNFFAYRLPYLKDYSRATGLKYTPRGLDAYTTRDTARYFAIKTPYGSDTTRMTTVGVTEYLNQAGNYDNFGEDCWAWQVARYRHTFYVPGSDSPGVDLGSYWMIHFKTEADFESFVRDGVMPWDAATPYEIYGATLVETAANNVASDKNLVNPLTTPPVAGWEPGTGPAPDYGYGSRSYHVLRSSLVTSNTSTLPTAVTNTYTWELDPAPVTMFVSGVAYFVPRNAAGDPSIWIKEADLEVSNAWIDFYRVADTELTGDPQAPPAVLSSPCPVFLGLAPFAYEANPTTGVPTFTVDPASFGNFAAHRQRVEVALEFLEDGAGNPFGENNGPLDASPLVLPALNDGILFLGDVDTPAFTSQAAPVAFVRRPLASTPIQPTSANNGNGIALAPQTVGPAKVGAKVLYHSTGWSVAVPANGKYGNFEDPGAPPLCDAALMTATKDVEERFLDEVYRYESTFGALPQEMALLGPGMNGWVPAPIAISVRAGRTAVIPWAGKSFFQASDHQTSLDVTELQVAGLPYRNPAYDPAQALPNPIPSAGILMYPKINYSAGYVPDNTVAGGGLAAPQVDYSAAAGTRNYVRVFDAAFSRDNSLNVDVAGQPFVTFRIDGLGLADFAYVAPGPGSQTVSGIAIMVKVPGLTTWMDLGRPDGDGPGKQDPVLDGAGCKVIGPYTYDGVDADTGMVYCQVRVNVGPGINLALGEASIAGRFEVPVMVKVIMNETAKGYDMTEEYVAPGLFGGVTKPGAAPGDVRGLCGVRVVNPRLVQPVTV